MACCAPYLTEGLAVDFAGCRELPQLRAQIKQMEEEKERLNDKVQKAAAQAAGTQDCMQGWDRRRIQQYLSAPCS